MYFQFIPYIYASLDRAVPVEFNVGVTGDRTITWATTYLRKNLNS